MIGPLSDSGLCIHTHHLLLDLTDNCSPTLVLQANRDPCD